MSKKRCTAYGAAVESLCELVRRVHFCTVDGDELELFYLQCVPPANLEGGLAKIDENRHKCITEAKKQSRWSPPFDGFPSVQTADWLGEKSKDTSNRKRFAACMKAVYSGMRTAYRRYKSNAISISIYIKHTRALREHAHCANS